MVKQATLLVIVPIDWGGRWLPHLEGTEFKVLLYKRDAYKPEDIDYVLELPAAAGQAEEFRI